ncbi:hypothetical protein [Phenylobacterium sp.]|uniref:hypothetical protein n=1 Tax=Phenylobacterium sp. TaxID=1871053 RepID=UPI0025E2CEAE|nr:hypothetical protein [Phenylobacterium sp.]
MKDGVDAAVIPLETLSADVEVRAAPGDVALRDLVRERLAGAGLQIAQVGEPARVRLFIWTPEAARVSSREPLGAQRTVHVRLRPCEPPPWAHPLIDVFGWAPGVAHAGWDQVLEQVGDLAFSAPAEGVAASRAIDEAPLAKPHPGGAGLRFTILPYVLFGTLLFTGAEFLDLTSAVIQQGRLERAWIYTPLFAAPLVLVLAASRKLRLWEGAALVAAMTVAHFVAIRSVAFTIGLTARFAVSELADVVVAGAFAVASLIGSTLSLAPWLMIWKFARIDHTLRRVGANSMVLAIIAGLVAYWLRDASDKALLFTLFPAWQVVYGFALADLVRDRDRDRRRRFRRDGI